MRCKVVKTLARGECGHPPRAECWEFTAAAPGLPHCKALCKKLMPCGHLCPRTCHAKDDLNHAAAMHDCRVAVEHRHPSCGHVESIDCRHVNAATTAPPICGADCDQVLPAPCGHPCVMRCGDVCAASADGGACRTCAEIKEEMRVARVVARAADAREAVERARELAVAVAEVERGNVRLDPGDSEFERIVEQIARTTQPGHGVTIRAKAIYKLENAARDREHFEAVGNMLDPSTHATQLFHGTATKNVERILAEGFRVSRNRASAGPASHAKNMLGAAVYLCPDASKAASKEYLGGATGVLLLCDVLLGSVKEVVAADEELDSPERRRHERYDSVMMRRTTAGRKTGVLYDEYAVYDKRLVLPRFAIEVEVSGGAPARPFRVPPRIEDGAEFFDITFADVERLGLDAPTPEAHHFYKAQALCTQLTARIGGGLKLAKVTYCRNPALEKLFADAERTLAARRLPTAVRYFFHGTAEENIKKIQLGGFKMPGVNIGHATDAGFWGKGIYLGVSSDVSMGYAKGAKMLLVATLGGRESDRRGTGRASDGATGLSLEEVSADARAVREGRFQSYDARNGEFIVASPVQTLPCYVVHWQ